MIKRPTKATEEERVHAAMYISSHLAYYQSSNSAARRWRFPASYAWSLPPTAMFAMFHVCIVTVPTGLKVSWPALLGTPSSCNADG